VNTQQPAAPWWKRAYDKWNRNGLYGRQTTTRGKVFVIVGTVAACALWLYITR
jgi:hypothetical protein